MRLSPEPSIVASDMSDIQGRIHSIESFGTVDGPGVRFVVFFQGCPMRCRYCHNPDTQSMTGGVAYTAEQIINKMKRNLPFYKTGGITATGGEPLVQLDFLIELFTLAKASGIHTALDTSGATFSTSSDALLQKYERLCQVCDLVMLDVKHMWEQEHIALTGRGNESVFELARFFSSHGVKIRLRHVLIPTVTDSCEHLMALGRYAASLPALPEIELLPYHKMGEHKYDGLGQVAHEYQTPTKEQINKFKEIFKEI